LSRAYFASNWRGIYKFLDDGAHIATGPKRLLSDSVLPSMAAIWSSTESNSVPVIRLLPHARAGTQAHVRSFNRRAGVTHYAGMTANVAKVTLRAEAGFALGFLWQLADHG
jgi:hypothetical protein